MTRVKFWKEFGEILFIYVTMYSRVSFSITRELLRDITDMGVPAASEFVEASTTQ